MCWYALLQSQVRAGLLDHKTENRRPGYVLSGTVSNYSCIIYGSLWAVDIEYGGGNQPGRVTRKLFPGKLSLTARMQWVQLNVPIQEAIIVNLIGYNSEFVIDV